MVRVCLPASHGRQSGPDQVVQDCQSKACKQQQPFSMLMSLTKVISEQQRRQFVWPG